MKLNRFIFSVCICAVMLMSQSAQSTLAATTTTDSFGKKIAGIWTGSGSIYQSAGAPRERVRCRFSSKWANKAAAISLRYMCLGIDIKFETTGTLKFNQASQTIAGKLVTVGIGAFKASGKLKGNKVTLSLTGKNKKTGKPVKGTLHISLKGNAAFYSTLSATDPKTGKRFQAFKASFKK